MDETWNNNDKLWNIANANCQYEFTNIWNKNDETKF